MLSYKMKRFVSSIATYVAVIAASISAAPIVIDFFEEPVIEVSLVDRYYHGFFWGEKELFKTFYRDREVDDIYSVSYRLTNASNHAIKPEDYISPITLKFPQENRVIHVEAIKYGSPSEGVSSKNGTYSLPKTLLNKNDHLNVYIYYQGEEAAPVFHGEIVNIKGFDFSEEEGASILTAVQLALSLFLLCSGMRLVPYLSSSFATASEDGFRREKHKDFFKISLCMIGYTVAGSFILREARYSLDDFQFYIWTAAQVIITGVYLYFSTKSYIDKTKSKAVL